MNSNKQLGLSLVEIMVAMIISIFLLGGVIQVYVGNKSTYNFSEAMARVQENGRFAMEMISRDLRMAGFWGCASLNSDDSSIVNNLNPDGPGYDENLHDFLNSPSVSGTENDGLNGSDSVTIRGAAPGQANVVEPYNSPTSAQIFADPGNFVEVDDIVLVTNCYGADLFQVTNVTQGAGTTQVSVVHNTGTASPGNYNPSSCNSGHCLSQTYGGESSLVKLQTIIYSIAEGTSGEPALFRQVFSDNQELIEGIEQLQILYGVDTDEDKTPNQYLTSEAVTAADVWSDVTTIRIMLLVVSSERASLPDDQTYTYNGANITSDDGRLRQVFSSTIALRNKI